MAKLISKLVVGLTLAGPLLGSGCATTSQDRPFDSKPLSERTKDGFYEATDATKKAFIGVYDFIKWIIPPSDMGDISKSYVTDRELFGR